ncbi:MAG: heavy metal translocating P-type ATPase [Sphaerobacteraceae bacterium]|nr:MAG: heavy metal translocating P-type ATPase [Sphaerobacteraceae bacterium]
MQHHHEHAREERNGHGHGDHDAHAGHDAEMFRSKFWLSLILTIPVVLYAEMIQEWFNYTAPAFPGSAWMPMILATIIFVYGGGVFIQGAWHEVQARKPGMMTLISLAIIVAFSYSIATELGFPGEQLYWELATLVTIMLLGHWIEMRAIGRAQSALSELAKLLPDMAERIGADGEIQQVSANELETGDLILVRPGASVPADGVVQQGQSSVNEAMITGESVPVAKGVDDEVIGGTVNGEGSLRVEITKTGENSALGGIMRLVQQAQDSGSRAQALADRVAGWLTYVALAAGSITLVVWLLTDEPSSFAIERMVTVFVIACPHALGLAIPLVTSISTTLSARQGLLVRDRIALEQARKLDTVVFDKTGTLTHGEMGVTDTSVAQGVELDEALGLIASVEGDSEHPIARAVRSHASERGIDLPALTDFESLPGRGVQAWLGEQRIAAGGPRLLEAFGIEPDPSIQRDADSWGDDGKAAIYLVVDDEVQAAFGLADVIRQESYDAVRRLKDLGVRSVMITGDSQQVADSVARQLGIDEVFAQVLPENKASHVQELRDQGRTVAMVGDGVNDAPALVTADVGIAIGAGTDVAIESAGIILVRNDPRDVVRIIELSRAGYRKMIQNLVWATGYNVIALPLAAGVLAPIGIILAPAIGAVLMSLSTIIVAANAQLLRRLDLDDV